MDNLSNINQRNSEREEFTYPVEFKMFSSNVSSLKYVGNVKSISPEGSRIEFEDRYGRMEHESIKDSKMKMSIGMPDGDKISLLAHICWVKKVPGQPFFVNMGVKFEKTEQWQVDAIAELMRLKNKDYNMMWSLWEQYDGKEK
ncbi:MAG: PilZ domain-containing protein [Nitrospira sp.]|nr:PilZ domain-containing protein [bacterium]MBL7049164.1 PilZ domain-containing protein [Nitrospira sp.]